MCNPTLAGAAAKDCLDYKQCRNLACWLWESSDVRSRKFSVPFALHVISFCFIPSSHPQLNFNACKVLCVAIIDSNHIGTDLGGIQMVGISRQSSRILSVLHYVVSWCNLF